MTEKAKIKNLSGFSDRSLRRVDKDIPLPDEDTCSWNIHWTPSTIPKTYAEERDGDAGKETVGRREII